MERIGENLVVEVPKTLQSIAVGSDAHHRQLCVKSHEAYLTEQSTLVIEERRRGSLAVGGADLCWKQLVDMLGKCTLLFLSICVQGLG